MSSEKKEQITEVKGITNHEAVGDDDSETRATGLHQYYRSVQQQVTTPEDRKGAKEITLDRLKTELDLDNLKGDFEQSELQMLYTCISYTTECATSSLKEYDRQRWLNKLEHFFRYTDTIFAVVDVVKDALPGPGKFVLGAISVAFKLAKKEIDLYKLLLQDLDEFAGQLQYANDVTNIIRESPRIKRAAIDLYAVMVNYWLEVPTMCQHKSLRHPGTWVPRAMAKSYEDRLLPLKNHVLSRISILRQIIEIQTLATIQSIHDQGRKQRKSDLDSKLNRKLNGFEEGLNAKEILRIPGTSMWIDELAEFQLWRSRSMKKPLFWLVGQPGVGKTVLATRLIRDASNEELGGAHPQASGTNASRATVPPHAVLYCLCMHDAEETLQCESIIQAFCFQLFRCWADWLWDNTGDYIDPKAAEEAKVALLDLFSSYGQDSIGNPMTCVTDLLTVMSDTRVTIFIDGLDEAQKDQSKKLWKSLQKLLTLREGQIRIYISSRPTIKLIDMLDNSEGFKKYGSRIDVNPKDVIADIGIYVGKLLWPKLSEIYVHFSPEELERLRKDVVDRIPPMSHGQFMWAQLMVSEAMACSTTTDLDGLLQEEMLPGNLEEMYSRIIIRLENDLELAHAEKARFLLRWCACNLNRSRPLQLGELADVFALRKAIGWTKLDPKAAVHFGSDLTWARISPLALRKLIERIGGCLLTLRPSEDKVPEKATLHFSHLSVKEFLQNSDPPAISGAKGSSTKPRPRGDSRSLLIDTSNAHADITWECLLYLSRRCFISRLVRTRGDAFELEKLKRWPFYVYAAEFWPQHLSKCGGAVQGTASHLQNFFSTPQVRTWMECVIALKDGLEWLGLSHIAIDHWLNANCVKNEQVTAYRCWAMDISDSSFMDYEGTILHNTNEVHYLDRHALFPNSVARFPTRFASAEEIQERVWDLGIDETEKDFLQSLIPMEDRCVPPENFLPALFVGESGENGYGFAAQDMNETHHECGVLLIDRSLNHPRLVWERVKNKDGDLIRQRSDRVRLASIHHAGKQGGHNLWKTLSGALTRDGTILAAAFSESVPASDTPTELQHIIVVFWRFRVATECEKDELKNWTNLLPKGDVAFATENIALRPPVPSQSPAKHGHDWAQATEIALEGPPFLIMKDDIFTGSCSLVAFHGSDLVVTPMGIFNFKFDVSQDRDVFTLRDAIWPQVRQYIDAEATIVPGGEYVLGFTSAARNTLKILKLKKGDTYGLVDLTSIITASSLVHDAVAFEHVEACSESGSHICLSLRKADGILLVGVLRLEDEDFALLYTGSSGASVQIMQCKFDRGVAPKLKNPESARRLQYLAFILKERVLGEIFTLMVYSMNDKSNILCEVLRSPPEGLMFYRISEASKMKARVLKDATMLVAFVRGRVVMQFELQNLKAIRSNKKDDFEVDGRYRSQRTINYACRPSDTMHEVGFAFVNLLSDSVQDSNNELLCTKATIYWWVWNTPGTDGGHDYEKSQFELDRFNDSLVYVRDHGIEISCDLQWIAIWIGRRVMFLRTLPGLKPVPWCPQRNSVQEKRVCVGTKFSASSKHAGTWWKPLEAGQSAVEIYSLSPQKTKQLASIGLVNRVDSFQFHPTQTSFAISSGEEITIYNISNQHIVLCHQVKRDNLCGQLQVHKTPIGPASPPRTGLAATSASSDRNDFDFRYSCCGTFLFTQNWNRFVPTSDPETADQPIIFRLHKENPADWSKLSADRPAIMREDVLYAAGQQRFKIFKIRSYLVLGWSADGTNLWEKREKARPTWYRRVICALPLSLGRWRAVMIWPKTEDDKVTVVLYPPEDLMEPRLPVIVVSPLSQEEMDPEDMDEWKWLHGHAAGCPYHLGIVAKDNEADEDKEDPEWLKKDLYPDDDAA